MGRLLQNPDNFALVVKASAVAADPFSPDPQLHPYLTVVRIYESAKRLNAAQRGAHGDHPENAQFIIDSKFVGRVLTCIGRALPLGCVDAETWFSCVFDTLPMITKETRGLVSLIMLSEIVGICSRRGRHKPGDVA